MPARIGTPTGVSGLVDDILTPSYACAIGLILYGAEQNQNVPLTKFHKKFKLPTMGYLGRIIELVKDLLP